MNIYKTVKFILYRHFTKIISVVILVAIFSLIDFRHIHSHLRKSNLELLLFCFCLIIPQLALRAYRWYYLLRVQQIECRFRDVALYYTASMYIGLLTPGRVGEISKALYLKTNNVTSFSRAMPSVLIDRILDAYVLFSCSILIIWISDLNADVYISNTHIYAIAALLIVLLLSPKLVEVAVQKLGAKIQKHIGLDATIMADEFVQAFKLLLRPHLIVAALLTLAHYTIYFFQTYLIANAMGMDIDVYAAFKVVSVATLIGFIPVTIAGLGTRDAVFLFLFESAGVAKSLGLSFAIVYDLIFVLGVGCIGMIVCWLLPLDIRSFLVKRNFKEK